MGKISYPSEIGDFIELFYRIFKEFEIVSSLKEFLQKFKTLNSDPEGSIFDGRKNFINLPEQFNLVKIVGVISKYDYNHEKLDSKPSTLMDAIKGTPLTFINWDYNYRKLEIMKFQSNNLRFLTRPIDFDKLRSFYRNLEFYYRSTGKGIIRRPFKSIFMDSLNDEESTAYFNSIMDALILGYLAK